MPVGRRILWGIPRQPGLRPAIGDPVGSSGDRTEARAGPARRGPARGDGPLRGTGQNQSRGPRPGAGNPAPRPAAENRGPRTSPSRPIRAELTNASAKGTLQLGQLRHCRAMAPIARFNDRRNRGKQRRTKQSVIMDLLPPKNRLGNAIAPSTEGPRPVLASPAVDRIRIAPRPIIGITSPIEDRP